MFAYAPGCGAEHAEKLHAGIRRGATFVSDGYQVYDGIADSHGLTHLGYWVHARRPFVKAEVRSRKRPGHRTSWPHGSSSSLASSTAPRRGPRSGRRSTAVGCAGATAPRWWRRSSSLLTNLHAVAPSSFLGEALHYLHEQWLQLIRFLESGTWPLDSKPVENAIRPFVVRRKGWLFADTVGGANASANLYWLVETAKANNIEPYRYLVALFKKLPPAQTADNYEALLPSNIGLPAA